MALTTWRKQPWTWAKTAVGVAVVATLAACGGGGGSSSTPPTSGSTSIGGVAGTGAPMAGAIVTVGCQSGSATATTDASGAFTATFSAPPAGPCAIKAVGVDGSGEELVQYSLLDTLSAGANKANINPATTVMAGQVINDDPEKFFADPTRLAAITPVAVAGAVAFVKEIVGTSIDPLKGVYVADKTNELDQKFDQLKLELGSAGTITVTSKVTGEVIGTVSLGSSSSDKAAYAARLNDPAVVPTTAPAFAALDTQFGAGLTAALAGSNSAAVAALIDDNFRDGGLLKTDLVSEVWSDARGAVIGKFTVFGCGNTGTAPLVEAYRNKTVCRVGAPVTLAGGDRDFFELRVIEKTAGTWLAWGDQRMHRIEIQATALKSVRFDTGGVTPPYQSGLQIWIPVPVGTEPEPEAMPNVAVQSAQVFIGTTKIADLGTVGCSGSDYLQLPGCSGNLVVMSDDAIQALIAAPATNKTVTVKLFGAGEALIKSYDIKLAALPVPVSVLSDPAQRYGSNFAVLNTASITALQQLGTTAQTFNVAWTAGVSVGSFNWNARSNTGNLGGEVELTGNASSASFAADVLAGANYASVYLVSRGSEGRKYWTKYFGCGGNTCF